MSNILKDRASDFWQLYKVVTYPSKLFFLSTSDRVPGYTYKYDVIPIDMSQVFHIDLSIEWHGGVTGGTIVFSDKVYLVDGAILQMRRGSFNASYLRNRSSKRVGCMFVVGSIFHDAENERKIATIVAPRDEFGDQPFFLSGVPLDTGGREHSYDRNRTWDIEARIKLYFNDTTSFFTGASDDDTKFYKQRTLAEFCDLLSQASPAPYNLTSQHAIIHSQSPWYFDGSNNVTIDTNVNTIDLVDGVNCVLHKNVETDFSNVLKTILFYQSGNDTPKSITLDDPEQKSFSGDKVTEIKIQTGAQYNRLFDKYIEKILAVNALPNFRCRASGVVLYDLIPFGVTMQGLPNFDDYMMKLKNHISIVPDPNDLNSAQPTNYINQMSFDLGYSARNKNFFNSFDFLINTSDEKSIAGFPYSVSLEVGLASTVGDYYNPLVSNVYSTVKNKIYPKGSHLIKFFYDARLSYYNSMHSTGYMSSYVNYNSPFSFFETALVHARFNYRYGKVPFIANGHTSYYPVSKINTVWNGKDFIADIEIVRTPGISTSVLQRNTELWNVPRSLGQKKK